jgi:fructan beta-fructosidase
MAFSGSAVVDTNNASGLGKGDTPAIVAVYTCHSVNGGQVRQSQHVAWSIDRGRSWQRYHDNPVIDIGSGSFRDPKVFWHEESQRWVMAVVLASERQVQFYGSSDLLRWSYLSSFGPAGNTQGEWECPDLIPLAVDGNPERIRWLLKVDSTLGGAAGGSGGQYFVGTFDGTRFEVEPAGDQPPDAAPPMCPLDYGSDFYAAMSWSNLPAEGGRCIWLAWMSNWRYASRVPTRPFRGIQSIPRSLHLISGNDGIRLAQRPVDEISKLRRQHLQLFDIPLQAGESRSLGDSPGAAVELSVRLAVQSDTAVALHLRHSSSSVTSVTFDNAAQELSVDRRNSSGDPFDVDFPARHCAPMVASNGIAQIRLLLDSCCLEVFGGQGESVISDLIFPDGDAGAIQIACLRGDVRIERLDLWHLDVQQCTIGTTTASRGSCSRE